MLLLQLVPSVLAVLVLSKVIEPVYGSRAYLKFLAIVLCCSGLTAFRFGYDSQPSVDHHILHHPVQPAALDSTPSLALVLLWSLLFPAGSDDTKAGIRTVQAYIYTPKAAAVYAACDTYAMPPFAGICCVCARQERVIKSSVSSLKRFHNPIMSWNCLRNCRTLGPDDYQHPLHLLALPAQCSHEEGAAMHCGDGQQWHLAGSGRSAGSTGWWRGCW